MMVGLGAGMHRGSGLWDVVSGQPRCCPVGWPGGHRLCFTTGTFLYTDIVWRGGEM
jgi:hypothetical protein